MEGKIRFQEFSKRNYVFFIAALVIFVWHMKIGLNMDSIWFGEQLEDKSYMEFLTKRYQVWTSRLLIEAGLLCSCYSLKDMNGAGWIVTINNYLFLVFLSLHCGMEDACGKLEKIPGVCSDHWDVGSKVFFGGN